MLSNCMNCGESKEIKIDKSNNLPVCVECGAVQEHMSKIMIESMIRNRDFIVSAETKVPFGIHCKVCNKTCEMIYDAKIGKARCSTCNEVADVNRFILKALEDAGHVQKSAQTEVE